MPFTNSGSMFCNYHLGKDSYINVFLPVWLQILVVSVCPKHLEKIGEDDLKSMCFRRVVSITT